MKRQRAHKIRLGVANMSKNEYLNHLKKLNKALTDNTLQKIFNQKPKK